MRPIAMDVVGFGVEAKEGGAGLAVFAVCSSFLFLPIVTTPNPWFA